MAYTQYRLQDGTRVPGVTTCLNVLGKGEGLIRWAWKMGDAGVSLDDARKKAMNIGTVTHSMIEGSIKGEEVDLVGLPAEVVEGARQAFEMWREWSDTMNYKPIASEVPLVSEEYRFGGTFDAVIIGGKRVLTDWKTSSGIYPEHLMQVAAYGALWNEAHPDEPIDGFALLRLGKEEPLFDYHFRPANAPTMQASWKAFRRCRELYDLMKIVKKGT